MFTIGRLLQFDVQDYNRVATGYTSGEKYAIQKTETDGEAQIILRLVRLEKPYIKRWDDTDEDVQRYTRIVEQGFSLAVRDDRGKMVGIGVAEPIQWNRTFWVWEFHIAEGCRGKGLGRQLMDALAEKGTTAGMRTMLVETQSTNAPAIRFYRKVGFQIEGVDISYYTNRDYPDGEMAVFMKRRLG